jgi:hypothetical protein
VFSQSSVNQDKEISTCKHVFVQVFSERNFGIITSSSVFSQFSVNQETGDKYINQETYLYKMLKLRTNLLILRETR